MTHDLVISKLYALNLVTYGINLICDYLKRRKQRVKIIFSFSSYLNLLKGVLQGVIIGPLLFNLFLYDLLLFVKESNIMGYADDDTPQVCFQIFSQRQMLTRATSFRLRMNLSIGH